MALRSPHKGDAIIMTMKERLELKGIEFKEDYRNENGDLMAVEKDDAFCIFCQQIGESSVASEYSKNILGDDMYFFTPHELVVGAADVTAIADTGTPTATPTMPKIAHVVGKYGIKMIGLDIADVTAPTAAELIADPKFIVPHDERWPEKGQ